MTLTAVGAGLGAGTPERLDFLISYNSRLWKKARQAVRDLFFYSLLLDEMRFKQILGAWCYRSCAYMSTSM
jgi:hypothetical protein